MGIGDAVALIQIGAAGSQYLVMSVGEDILVFHRTFQ